MENQDGAFYCRQPSANYQILIISTYNLNIQYQKYIVTQKYKRLEIKNWFFQWNHSLIGIAGVTPSEQCTALLYFLGILIPHKVDISYP